MTTSGVPRLATTLALIPLGYAEGIPRAASSVAEVWIDGVRHPVRGRIAMDQLVVDVGDAAVRAGDIAVLFGDPAARAPERGRLGSVGRHHQLRDRDPHRSAGRAAPMSATSPEAG